MLFMPETGFKNNGLKCGLEVHQQLDTGKLFCRCPSVLREEKPDFLIKRFLRPVVSEMGEYDKAALEAYQKGLFYVYEAHADTNCIVETDDCPPKPADEEAVNTILTIAMLSNCAIFERVPVMRKLVIDGSNTSGFQRTALVAVNGFLEISSRKRIGIQSLALEEDAARTIEKAEDHVVYRLDRLGIPLIELATAPDIATPEEAKEVALAIGTLFRRTCKAKRGLGTIRQDLNVSIPNGARIEIKGVQELELIDEFVKREVQRQQGLLEIKELLKDRGATKEALEQPATDCSEIFLHSNCRFLNGKNVSGNKVPHFFEVFGTELQPNRRFGTEVAGYVKVKTGLQGILHSDELPAYGVSKEEVEKVKQKLGCKETDAFVLVSGSKEKTVWALQVVKERCQAALEGVPEETRQAMEGGNTEYLRPLPGAARMYPETDLQPIEITGKKLAELGKRLPLTPEQRVSLYTKNGLSQQLAEKMKLDNWACFFEQQLEKKRNASFMAWILLEGLVQLEREKIPVEWLREKQLDAFFEAHQKGLVLKENALDLLKEWSQNPNQLLETMLKQKTVSGVSENEIERIIEKIVSGNAELVKQKGLGATGALMGDAMKELRGKTSGEKVSELLKKAIQKQLNP
jgi:glutamyl-tRNA(Gln) amidotransferase subunit E